MPSGRPNNPRAFAETVAVDVWRTPFSGDRAEADLHIDVVFGEGRIGGKAQTEYSPVRFRLSLKQAEVNVVGDGGGYITMRPSSVVRSPMPTGTETMTIQAKHSAQARGKISVRPSCPSEAMAV